MSGKTALELAGLILVAMFAAPLIAQGVSHYEIFEPFWQYNWDGSAHNGLLVAYVVVFEFLALSALVAILITWGDTP